MKGGVTVPVPDFDKMLTPKFSAIGKVVQVDGSKAIEHKTFTSDPMAYVLFTRNRIFVERGLARPGQLMAIWTQACWEHLASYVSGRSVDGKMSSIAPIISGRPFEAFGVTHYWNFDVPVDGSYWFDSSIACLSTIAVLKNCGVR